MCIYYIERDIRSDSFYLNNKKARLTCQKRSFDLVQEHQTLFGTTIGRFWQKCVSTTIELMRVYKYSSLHHNYIGTDIVF